MEVVKELYDIEHTASDDYTGPSKYEIEFIIGPIANAGLSKMHAAMHTAMHYHMGRGHQDRLCCTPNFDPGIHMLSRSLRESLIYGTRKVRTRGLKVDESIRMMQFKYHSKPIRNSLVYGTRTKRCRHKHCTAWDHQHEWNQELEKWDIPMSMLKNEKRKTLWFEARQSVLDQEMIKRKSIPKNCYGELETDGGLYCGYYLPEVVLKPWYHGGHTHDFYRHTRDIRSNDWMWEPSWYDPEPEKIEYHKKKMKELKDWHRRRNLIGDMRYLFARVAEARRQRRHFQHLKLRLKKKVLLWTELNQNSLWFMPWPKGDQLPLLIRRSLMAISKQLSTCAPMWNPYFADLPTCKFYLDHLDELAPAVWDRFHYKCKKHKHLDPFERSATLLTLMEATNVPSVHEETILPPLCEPVLALDGYRKQWVEILASRPPPPKIILVEQEEDVETSRERDKKGKKIPTTPATKEQPTIIKGKKGVVESKSKTRDSSQQIDMKAQKIVEKKRGGELQVVVEQQKKRVRNTTSKTSEDKKVKLVATLDDHDKKMVEASKDTNAPSTKRKKSVKIDPPLLPAQLTFLKKGEGRQSMAKPPLTLEELKALERLNPHEELEHAPLTLPIKKRCVRWSIQNGRVTLLSIDELKALERLNPPEEPEPVLKYVPFKFPIKKHSVRWSIQGGKVPLLPQFGSISPLSNESARATLDLLDLDKFEAKLEESKPKASQKKGKEATKDKKGLAKVDSRKKGVKQK